MNTVYIETSIISYLRQRRSADIVTATHRLLTRRRWDTEREKYDLVISQFVIDEAAAGDPRLAAERLAVLAQMPLLPATLKSKKIAALIMSQAVLPSTANVDALHIAYAAHHRVEYLLTWNCKHIANARILPRIYGILDELEIPRPIICTPEELLGDDPEFTD